MNEVTIQMIELKLVVLFSLQKIYVEDVFSFIMKCCFF